MRLIDADEAVKAVHDEFDECLVWDESGATTANEFENIILQIPTVDPVKHGHWEVVDGTEPRRYGCSICKRLSWTEDNYCSYCGAKMDEVEDGKID